MSLHRKNLLEAFKKSDAPAAAGPPVSSASSAAPQAAPFQSMVAAPRARAGQRKDLVWALGVVAVVLSFVLGFVVGRNTQGEARAEAPAPLVDGARPRPANQPRSFQERPATNPDATSSKTAGAGTAAPGGASPADGEKRIEDSALFDPANLWTVIVATYTKSNQDFAWATYEHLRDAKLPVFPPVESRNLVVVLAGAAPTSAELAKVEAAVKSLARDGKKKDYADAYCARIDPLIPRPKKGTSKP
jgi:hypothetical protein